MMVSLTSPLSTTAVLIKRLFIEGLIMLKPQLMPATAKMSAIMGREMRLIMVFRLYAGSNGLSMDEIPDEASLCLFILIPGFS
jgi:hypothetical protein